MVVCWEQEKSVLALVCMGVPSQTIKAFQHVFNPKMQARFLRFRERGVKAQRATGNWMMNSG